MKDKKIIVGNWKMNPRVLSDAKKIFGAIKKQASKRSGVQTVICAPFVFLNELKKMVTGHRCVLGAQDIFWERGGSYTGEISPSELRDAGAQYVIVGHSERRALGETNEDVMRKIRASVDEGLAVILCVGENKRDIDGRYFSFIEEELKQAFSLVKQKEFNKIIIAYEPIWAIGENAKRSATPHEFEEMVIFIRKILVDMFGKKHGLSASILYGGSVDDTNARSFLCVPNTSGLLVGRGSLEPKIFNAIIDTAASNTEELR